MSTCHDCRFWNRNGVNVCHDDEECDPRPTETNAQLPREGDRKRCLRILHFDQYERTGQAPAVLTDGSGYAAALWTAADFGCSLFEHVVPVLVESKP
jgi:hypothetical protein